MKKKIFSLLVLLAAAVSGTWAQDKNSDCADNCPVADKAVQASRVATAGPRKVAAEFGEAELSFNCSTYGQYGVATDGEHIYTSKWNSNAFYKYDMDGNFIEEFSIPNGGSIRDMTYDGEYFYGVANGSTIYQMDFESKTLVGTIYTGTTMRGVTYDPKRDGFWAVGNWSGPLALYDRDGNWIQDGIYAGSVSGIAYYEDEDGEEHILQPNNGNNYVYDYNITTNTLEGAVFYLGNVPGYSGGSSGGCFIGEYNGQVCLFADIQQDPNLIGIVPIANAKSSGFALTKATDAEAHGTISFKVVEGEKLLENATKSKEGNMVIVTIAPETGWAVGEVNGEWYAAVAAARRSEGANEDASNATIELLKDFGPEFADEVEGSGTKTYAFTMQRANAEISVKYQKLLTHTDISIFDIQPVTYNGQEQTPAIIVKDDQTVLVQDKDYTVEYSDNTDAGTGTATITGIGAYEGQVEKPIIINKADITTTAPTAVTELTYNAQPQTLISAGTAEDAEMLYSLDGENYSTELPAATDAKEYTVYFKVEGDKNHNDVNVQAIKVTIAQAELTAATLASTNLVYNQQEQTVEVTSVSAGTLEVPENGFDVAGDKATAVGTYTATIKGKGNFKGEVTAQFCIVAADAQLFSLTLATTEFTYTGKELTPAVTVKDGEGNLVNYVDYTVAYSANVDAGTATVTVTGQGNYSGTQTAAFTISKAPLTVTAGDASVIYANEAPQFTVTYEGFVNNETNDVLSGSAAFTCEYTVESPVGSTFAITPGGLTSNNYDITFVPGTLTVVTDPASVAVMEKIDAIGEVVYTSECHALIDFVRTDYDALTAAQKTLVTNYGVLTAAEAKYAELKADYEAAADAITKIALIGEVAYTDVCKELIDAARAAYDALTDAQKALVGNLDVLTADEAKYAELAATGIKSLYVNGNDNWYDLNGRKVANGQLKKGIYIKNGKKIVVK